jgi:hydrogenase-4 component B
LAVVAASLLALTGGLAAACFVKAFGLTFLGRPRSVHAEHAVEAPISMRAAMLFLAALCVGLGVFPGACLRLLDAPVSGLLGGAPSALVTVRGPLVLTAMGSAGVGTSVSTTMVAALFAAFAVGAAILSGWPRAAGRRFAPTWTCGIAPESRFDYTATAFAKPLRFIFAALYRPHREVEKNTGPTAYGLESLRWTGDVVDFAEVGIYRRFNVAVLGLARRVRKRSTGRIHGYIGFVLLTLVVLLLAFGSG